MRKLETGSEDKVQAHVGRPSGEVLQAHAQAGALSSKAAKCVESMLAKNAC